MDHVEGMRKFTDLLSQVGITAFALMFAAIQIRWQGSREPCVSRMGETDSVVFFPSRGGDRLID